MLIQNSNEGWGLGIGDWGLGIGDWGLEGGQGRINFLTQHAAQRPASANSTQHSALSTPHSLT
ncbi:hypothetical protein [Nostoc sp. CMAA1605]|uniref:hypothetical protein n=1 Tax=Nostoc sp. CMAA1605 TaxID=2055159 RepID=UPI001F483103|nr:hypothetical protein [Nostoc sp. CMAA1605]MCF4968917.1 hypothetical protein [Nostoc sp. CMAA1605]